MTDPATEPEPLTAAELGVVAVLVLIAELSVKLGVDPEPSETAARAGMIMRDALRVASPVPMPPAEVRRALRLAARAEAFCVQELLQHPV